MPSRTHAVVIVFGIVVFVTIAGLWLWPTPALELTSRTPEAFENVPSTQTPGAGSVTPVPGVVAPRVPAVSSAGAEPEQPASRRYLASDDYKLMAKLRVDQRDCEANNRCPQGMACWMTPDRKIGCYASNCRGVGDVETCAPGDACVSTTLGLFRCSPAGFLKPGAECLNLQTASAERRCAGGLLCLAGRCSEGCVSDKDCGSSKCLSTSHGSFCARADGLCKAGTDCKTGQHCLQSKDGVGVCAVAATMPSGSAGCVPGECGANEVCSGRLWGDQFFGTCLPLCSNGTCPAGFVCAPSDTSAMTGENVCYRRCEPGDEVCGPDGDCSFSPEKGIGICVTPQPHDRTVNAGIEQEQMMTSAPDAWPGSPRP